MAQIDGDKHGKGDASFQENLARADYVEQCALDRQDYQFLNTQNSNLWSENLFC